MDFNSKCYQNIKIKKFFKTNSLFFWRYSIKQNSIKSVGTQQKLKKWKFNSLETPKHGVFLKLFDNSIFKRFQPFFYSLSFTYFNFKTNKLQLKSIKKEFKPIFEFVLLKLNNKIYSSPQLKGLKELSYKKTVFNFYKSLDQNLKTTYLLRKKK